ncbi:BON domain-containing protein [Paraburkholderia sp. CNPSo 3274]|uniref:BON domain-containing protein n=1 Tax=Paraburkholderia sp. CNPSo 3274 TaxID=2940932 RepID=UPI0020B73172|nr:BON domain-containing protein [Paraburkholderia sp. CNPSo 3274]MCP3710094.1 BON domain-containing protein [Paraburkholderia sp. CNPSo 3274]
MKTDTQLKQDVLDELAFDAALDASRICAEVANGVVTLAGSVPSLAQTHAAERVAQRVSGVRAVVMRARVEVPVTDAPNDEAIAEMARAVLHWTVGVPQRGVEVEVANGHIFLRGAVEWEWQRELAIRSLVRLRGVTGITSRVEAHRRMDPRKISERIGRALLHYAEDEATRIHVEMSESVVKLKGTVASEAERAVARGAAWAQPGVSAVIDELVLA